MKACCPYCDCEAFYGEAIRADGVDVADPMRFAESDGQWFNKCKGCDKWSLHKEGKQLAIKAANRQPKPYSLPPV